jgi:hypothetical protein
MSQENVENLRAGVQWVSRRLAGAAFHAEGRGFESRRSRFTLRLHSASFGEAERGLVPVGPGNARLGSARYQLTVCANRRPCSHSG